MELAPPSDAALAQAVTWHRHLAAMVEAADRAGVATAELAGMRARLSAQATLLAQAATRRGAPLPALVPTPAEIATAGASLGDLSTTAVGAALRSMSATLASVDSALGAGTPTRTVADAGSPGLPTPAPPPPPRAGQPSVPSQPPAGPWAMRPGGPMAAVTEAARRSVQLRNAAVYGAYSVVVLGVQGWLFLLLDEARELPMAAPLCLVVLPALAWAAGWLTIGALFRPPANGKLDRTPRLGLVVALIPNGLLLAALVVLFAINRWL